LAKRPRELGGRKKKGDDGPPGAPAWMVTFGDLMSLLLTFFVLLLSFSVMEESKVSQAIESIQGALGVMDKNSSVFEFKQVADNKASQRSEAIKRLARRLRRRMQVLGKESDVSIEFNKKGGLKINLPSEMLFDSAQADLKSNSAPVLQGIAALLVDVPDKFVEVRGHTDNRPLTSSGRFRDNHDLSYERARNVMAFLTGAAGMRSEEFEVIALGDSQPIAPNDTEEGRIANRRVEIQIRGDFSDETLEDVHQNMNLLTRPPTAIDQ